MLRGRSAAGSGVDALAGIGESGTLALLLAKAGSVPLIATIAGKLVAVRGTQAAIVSLA